MTDSKRSEITLSEQFPISVLCDFIGHYKGERETLTAFLTNCQNALDLASPSQKILLNKYILARLQGKAQVACSNKVFEDFNELKCFLKQNFGERKHYNHLLIDLQSCKQQSNETVSQFSLRIESCLTDLQSEIHNSDTLKRDLSGRIAMTEDLALHTFCLGLHPQISNNVRCRSPKNLNDAINIALEEEKIQNLLHKTSKSNNFSKKCRVCGKLGHTEHECYSKKQNTNSHRVFHEAKPQNSIFCRYCKKNGHDISECRRRKYNNERRNNNSHGNNKPNGIHHITYNSSPPCSPTPSQVSCEIGEESNNLNE